MGMWLVQIFYLYGLVPYAAARLTYCVYAGSDGQTGHGHLYHMKTPQIVEDLEPISITSIGCGSNWSVAVSDVGQLYAWGNCDGTTYFRT
jgi:alpha-tubulin suppressor-like RCC1 family protein